MREDRKRQYESDIFYWETAIATIWTLLIAVLLMGSAYTRLGKPSLDATSPAEAAATSTVGSASNRSND